MNAELVPIERIERAILLLRGHKVTLDVDLAVLCGVETKALNRAIKRNIDRFPADFMFQLTPDEGAALRRHFGTSNTGGSGASRSEFGTSKGRGGRRYAPCAFTEIASLAGLARKLDVLERKYDRQFKIACDAIRELMTLPDPKPRRRIGFGPEEER